jgi:hypothetical protein
MASDVRPGTPLGFDPSDNESILDVVACVTFHTTRSSTTKGKKVAKKTTTKDMRAKEFKHNFVASKPNYFAFLQTILDNHHLSQYKVSDQATFPCKIQVPPGRCVTIFLLHRRRCSH